MSRSRYLDIQISPSYNTKLDLFALDNVSEMKGVYRVPLVPVYQRTSAVCQGRGQGGDGG